MDREDIKHLQLVVRTHMKNQDQVDSKNVKSKHQVYRKLLKINPRWTGEI